MTDTNNVNYYIMNTKFEDVAPLDDYQSLIWTDRYSDVGDFEIYSGITEQAQTFFKMNYYLRSLYSEHVMILSSSEISSDVESGDALIIRGESLESILKRRIVWTQTLLNGNFQDELERLFNENIINPSVKSRKIDNFIFVKSEDEKITSLTVKAQFTGDTIYDAVKSLCDKFKLGFKITLTPKKEFAFMLYNGENRTYGQKTNPYVVISKTYDNIVSSDYLVSNDTLRNVALVAGEGEGTERKTYITGNDAISGLNRRELYVDARDISSTLNDGGTLPLDEYNELLKQRGDEKLSDTKITKSFDGQIDPLGQFEYQKDYFLGDIIQFEDGYGNSAHARVAEFVYSESTSGTEAYPTLNIFGETVTYRVDIEEIYTEEVDSGETVLSPKTFTPKKSGWEFVGWRLDDQANPEVETTLTMAYDPITLYAVFRKSVVVTYYNPDYHTAINYNYYNNGNLVNARFTLSPATYAGWTFRGWTTSSSPNGSITYPVINNTEISENVTLYQSFEQTIILTVYNGNATANTYSDKAYGNGISNIYPRFTVTPKALTGWIFRGWSTSSVGNGRIDYSSISNTEFTSNVTLYGLYQYQTAITLSYNSSGGSGQMTVDSGTRYFSSNGTYINPTFTVRPNSFTKSGYNFSQWRLNGASGQAYSPGASIELTANAVLYAEWTAVPLPTYATMVLPDIVRTNLVSAGEGTGYAGRCVFTITVGTQYAGKRVRWKLNLPTGYTILTNWYKFSGSSSSGPHKIGNITNSGYTTVYGNRDDGKYAYWNADALTDVATVDNDGVIRIKVANAQPEYNGYDEGHGEIWAYAEKITESNEKEIYYGYGRTYWTNRLATCSVTLEYL